MKSSISALLMLLIISCRPDGSESTSLMAENLDGTWTVVSATRNNRPALSLENSEFYISDSLFSTNFLPDTNAYAYSFDGKTIRLADEDKSSFHVSRKAKDTLIFKTEIKNFDFMFVATKKQTTNEI